MAKSVARGDTVNAKFTGKKGVSLDLSLEDPDDE